MNRKLTVIIPVVAVLITLTATFRADTPVAAAVVVYIRTDGSVTPPTAPISSSDNVTYTLSGNIYLDVVIERNNIIVDGKGYTVQGTGIGSGVGIFLSGRNNIIIKNVIVKKFDIGIWLGSTSNSTIYGNNITNNEHGIQIGSSSGNTFSGNNITNNDFGITLQDSSNNNLILKNDIANNYDAVWLFSSSKNTIWANNIVSNDGYCMALQYSCNNTIYNNNFENIKNQIYIKGSENAWDGQYPNGGNHWSDYASIDRYSGPFQNQMGGDGISDTLKTLDANNTDEYPLVGMFYDFPVTLEDYSEKHLQVVSNSSIHELQLMRILNSNQSLQPDQKLIRLLLSGADNTTGFCRMTIPRIVLNDNYTVLVDWKPVPARELPGSNNTHAYLYFTYQHTEHEVIIVSELSPFTVLQWYLLSTITALTAVLVHKRRTQ